MVCVPAIPLLARGHPHPQHHHTTATARGAKQSAPDERHDIVVALDISSPLRTAPSPVAHRASPVTVLTVPLRDLTHPLSDLANPAQEDTVAALAVPEGAPAPAAPGRRRRGRHARPGPEEAGRDPQVPRRLEGHHAHRGRDAAQGQVHHVRPQGEEVSEGHTQ